MIVAAFGHVFTIRYRCRACDERFESYREFRLHSKETHA